MTMLSKLTAPTFAVLLAAIFGACKKQEQTASVIPEAKRSPEMTSANPEKGVLLKVKWPVGSRYVYRMDLDQHSTNKFPQMPKPMQQDVTMAMTYGLSVLKEIPVGGRELEMEFLANEMEMKMGEQVMMSFDSKETPKNEAQNPFTAPYRKMIGSKLRLQVDADGRVDKIIGLQEWLDTITADVPGPGKGMMAQQFNEGYFRQIVDFGRGFPKKPVQEGETWPFQIELPLGPMGKLSITAKVTFKGLEEHEKHHTVALATTGTLKGSPGQEAGPMGKMSIEDGTVTAMSWFDPELGAMIESSADQAMRLKGELPGQPGGNQPSPGFTSDIAQKVTIKLVELGKTKK
jgi:hypothetical protein